MQSSWSRVVGTLIHDSLAILQGVDIQETAHSAGRTPQIFTSGWTLLLLWLCRVPQQFWRISKPQQNGVVPSPPMAGSPHTAVTIGLSPTMSCPLAGKDPWSNHNNFFGLRWSRAPQFRMNNPKGYLSFRLLQTCACAKMHNLWIWDRRGCSRTNLPALDLRVRFTCHLHISVRGDVCCRQG